MQAKSYITIIAVLMGMGGTINGQESWDLQRCVDYALENNISIKQQEVSTDFYGNELKQAKNNRLPAVTGSATNSFSFGRSLQSDNTYAEYNSNVTSGSINASLTLWNGFVLQKSVNMADFNLKASLEDLQKAKDDITLNVAASYLQILLAAELVQVARDQLEVTNLQIERTRKLVEGGNLARGSLLEIEAQFAQEEVNLVDQQNTLQLSYLNLFQLLELPAGKEFTIVSPDIPELKASITMTNSLEVYRNAEKIRPEIRSAGFTLESYKQQAGIARGNLYPSLSMGFDYYNFYNNKYRYTEFDDKGLPIQGDKISFGDQLKNNDQYALGFTMRVPLFNRLQGRTDVKNAKLQVATQEFELQNVKNTLRKEIEQAYTNALAALKKYTAGSKAVSSMQEAFRYTEEKLSVGKVNSIEYNQAKNNLTKAVSDLAQAKFDFIFRAKILDFYNGIPIEL